MDLITIEKLSKMLFTIPKDGKVYKWLMNYQQYYEVSLLRDGQGDFIMRLQLLNNSHTPTLFGLVIEVDNQDLPIRLEAA